MLERLFPDALLASASDPAAFGLNAASDGYSAVLPQNATGLAGQLCGRGFRPTGATFIPRPLRAVKAAHVRQAGCPSDFILAVAGFEPPEKGAEFETADTSTVPGWQQTGAAELHEAFGSGVREEPAVPGPGTTAAVTVVLRTIKVHEIGSHPRAFHQAGRPAGRTAPAEAFGAPTGRRP